MRTINLDWLRERLSQAAAVVAHTTSRTVDSVDVCIVSDEEMIKLHELHKSVACTTDVLSFDLSGNEDGAGIQADIVVCADEAIRQSTVLGHSMERELLLYALHGLLHCAGYDDETDSGSRAMHEEEDRILIQIGVGAIFHAGGCPDSAQDERA